MQSRIYVTVSNIKYEYWFLLLIKNFEALN